MIIKVIDSQSANRLTTAMSSGNCIVLYHMEMCPYCVQMMPAWNNFIQTAKRSMPELVIGEVERTHLDKVDNGSVSSFPTIKFYKRSAVPSQNEPMIQQQEANANSMPQKNTFKNVLRNIMNTMQQPTTVETETTDNSVMFNDNRTTDKLISFVKDNLEPMKKGKKSKRIANAVKKAIKTRKVKAIKKQELTNALTELPIKAKKGKNTKNSNMMELPEYTKAKKGDKPTAKKIKKSILG
jgi:hypothetical protein